MVELTEKQKEAIDICVSRYKSGKSYTCIAGYAGVGKSTIIPFIIQALGFDPARVAYVAYTGRAALILREKGCPNAVTAHKLLYKAYRQDDGNYRYVPKLQLDEAYQMIVVDEVSMLPDEMWNLLLSHHIYTIACGDPGQLEPVRGKSSVLQYRHVFLDQIMRQAEDNEIIKLSMEVRQGHPLSLYSGKDVRIVDKSDLSKGMLLWADQIIVAKNATRNFYNDLMRHYIYGDDVPDLPVEGDKVIALHNDYKCLDDFEEPLVNGEIGTIHNISYKKNKTSYRYKNKYVPHDIMPEFMYADFVPNDLDGHGFSHISMDKKLFATGEPTITGKNFRLVPPSLQPHEFDYAYVVTGWKMQGSSAPRVLVIEEDFPWGVEEHRKFLYTCCTRAEQKLIIVRK